MSRLVVSPRCIQTTTMDIINIITKDHSLSYEQIADNVISYIILLTQHYPDYIMNQLIYEVLVNDAFTRSRFAGPNTDELRDNVVKIIVRKFKIRPSSLKTGSSYYLEMEF